jgi:uncharacterized DUF497 family protein
MEFEFDPLKSKANQAKHGIDFVDAQALWNDPSDPWQALVSRDHPSQQGHPSHFCPSLPPGRGTAL